MVFFNHLWCSCSSEDLHAISCDIKAQLQPAFKPDFAGWVTTTYGNDPNEVKLFAHIKQVFIYAF